MKRETVSPMGYLAENWVGANEDAPALVVNPQASAVDLLAWVCGELCSLEAAARALVDVAPSDSFIAVCHFEAIFVHRLGPMERVLDLALSELIVQREANGIHACTLPSSASTQGGAT